MLKKFKELFHQQLMQGVSPRELALTCSFAFMLGLFPMLGTTTLLCLLVGMYFKLNQPALQILNYLITPLHLLMIPTFLYIGESILGIPHLKIDLLSIPAEFVHDWRAFMANYGFAGLHAIFAWALITPGISVIIYFLSKKAFESMKRKKDEK